MCCDARLVLSLNLAENSLPFAFTRLSAWEFLGPFVEESLRRLSCCDSFDPGKRDGTDGGVLRGAKRSVRCPRVDSGGSALAILPMCVRADWNFGCTMVGMSVVGRVGRDGSRKLFLGFVFCGDRSRGRPWVSILSMRSAQTALLRFTHNISKFHLSSLVLINRIIRQKVLIFSQQPCQEQSASTTHILVTEPRDDRIKPYFYISPK